MSLPVRIRPGRRTAQDGHGDNRGDKHPAHESASLKTQDFVLLYIGVCNGLTGVCNGLTSECRVAPQMV